MNSTFSKLSFKNFLNNQKCNSQISGSAGAAKRAGKLKNLAKLRKVMGFMSNKL